MFVVQGFEPLPPQRTSRVRRDHGHRRAAGPYSELVAIQLRDGINIPNSIERLRQCAGDLRNIPGGSSGMDTPRQRDRYLSAVESVEPQLRNLSDDPAVWNHLYGDRYWIIRSAGEGTPRPMPLINGEAEDQARYIDSLIEHLDRLAKRLAAAPGEIAVLDTHVLLHFMPPQQVDWCEVLGQETVRLVLPLRVVEELDMSKYRERDDLADRARRLLSQLWGSLLRPLAGPWSFDPMSRSRCRSMTVPGSGHWTRIRRSWTSAWCSRQ